ncbi:hypothetical protein EEDFHM_04346 [Methylorubrum populi]
MIGFLAVGLAVAALLHSWALPRSLSYGALLLTLIGAGFTLFAETGQRRQPRAIAWDERIAQMPPTEGRPAPARSPKRQAEAAIVW